MKPCLIIFKVFICLCLNLCLSSAQAFSNSQKTTEISVYPIDNMNKLNCIPGNIKLTRQEVKIEGFDPVFKRLHFKLYCHTKVVFEEGSPEFKAFEEQSNQSKDHSYDSTQHNNLIQLSTLPQKSNWYTSSMMDIKFLFSYGRRTKSQYSVGYYATGYLSVKDFSESSDDLSEKALEAVLSLINTHFKVHFHQNNPFSFMIYKKL